MRRSVFTIVRGWRTGKWLDRIRLQHLKRENCKINTRIKKVKFCVNPGFFTAIQITSYYSYLSHADSLSENTNSKVVLEEVLEEAPKWKVLRVSE